MNYGNTPALFSDALERAYTQAVMDSSEPLSIKDTAKRIVRGAKRAGARAIRVIDEVLTAQAEARARSARYTRAQW